MVDAEATMTAIMTIMALDYNFSPKYLTLITIKNIINYGAIPTVQFYKLYTV